MDYQTIEQTRTRGRFLTVGGVVLMALAVLGVALVPQVLPRLRYRMLMGAIAAEYRQGGLPAAVKSAFEYRYLVSRNSGEINVVADPGGQVGIEVAGRFSEKVIFIGVYDPHVQSKIGKFAIGYGAEDIAFLEGLLRGKNFEENLLRFLQKLPRVIIAKDTAGSFETRQIPDDLYATPARFEQQLGYIPDTRGGYTALCVLFLAGVFLGNFGRATYRESYRHFEARLDLDFARFQTDHGQPPQTKLKFAKFLASPDLQEYAKTVRQLIAGEDETLREKNRQERLSRELNEALFALARAFGLGTKEWDEVSVATSNGASFEVRQALRERLEKSLAERAKQEQLEEHQRRVIIELGIRYQAATVAGGGMADPDAERIIALASLAPGHAERRQLLLLAIQIQKLANDTVSAIELRMRKKNLLGGFSQVQ